MDDEQRVEQQGMEPSREPPAPPDEPAAPFAGSGSAAATDPFIERESDEPEPAAPPIAEPEPAAPPIAEPEPEKPIGEPEPEMPFGEPDTERPFGEPEPARPFGEPEPDEDERTAY